MIRTCFRGIRTLKKHFGAFRQSLVLWSTLGFGQSRLWIFGSTAPWCLRRPWSTGPYWPRSTVRLNFSRTSPNVFSSYGQPATQATVDRTFCELPNFSECDLSYGPPVKVSTVNRDILHLRASSTEQMSIRANYKLRSTGHHPMPSSPAHQDPRSTGRFRQQSTGRDPTRSLIKSINNILVIFFIRGTS